MEPVRRDSPEQSALMLVAGAVEHVDELGHALAAEASETAAALVYSSLMQVRGALAMAEQTAEGYEAARQAGRHERDAESQRTCGSGSPSLRNCAAPCSSRGLPAGGGRPGCPRRPRRHCGAGGRHQARGVQARPAPGRRPARRDAAQG